MKMGLMKNIDRMGVMCNDIIKQLGDLRNNSRLVDDVGRKKVFCWWVLPTQENHLCLIVCWEERGLSRLILQERLAT